MNRHTSVKSRYHAARVFLVGLFTILYCFANAQGNPTDSLPPDPGGVYINVTKVQDMNFGAFSRAGSGGTITISAAGVRSTTGGVVALNLGYLYFQAIFDVESPQGTGIAILNGPSSTLTGSNGGTMSLQITDSSPASPFVNNVAPPGTTRVYIGGTLTVGSAAASPPGSYQGTFDVTFNYN